MQTPPSFHGTSPMQRAVGGDIEGGIQHYDDEGTEVAKCRRCGWIYKGNAQCDCNLRTPNFMRSPQPVTPSSPYRVPTPHLVNLRRLAQDVKRRKPRDEFHVDVPESLRRRSEALQMEPEPPPQPHVAHPVVNLLMGGADEQISPTLSFQVHLPPPQAQEEDHAKRRRVKKRSFKHIGRLLAARHQKRDSTRG